MNRRELAQAIAGCLVVPALAAHAAGSTDGPIRLLVGFPPGGAADVLGRHIVQKLSEAMGRTIYVENRSGAGGQIAAQVLKAALPDGSTIMLSIDHTQVVIPLTVANAGYHPTRDFTALAGLATYYNVLAVGSSTGVKSMAELAAWVKAHPNQANYGIPAAGSVPQFIGDIVGKSFGVSMNSVPYRGGAPLIQDLLAGQVPIAVASMAEIIDHHRAGKVRILASSGTRRSRIAPDIPTFAEQGFIGIEKNPWLAFFGPKGLSAAFVAQFETAVRSVLEQAELKEKIEKLGNEVNPAPGREVQQWVTQAYQHWGQVIHGSGFKPQ